MGAGQIGGGRPCRCMVLILLLILLCGRARPICQRAQPMLLLPTCC